MAPVGIVGITDLSYKSDFFDVSFYNLLGFSLFRSESSLLGDIYCEAICLDPFLLLLSACC